jgi:hypothetical protein
MPEVVAVIRKFEADFRLTPQSWLHVRNPARTLFLRYRIDQQHGLAPLYLRIHREHRTVNANRVSLGNAAEWPVICGASVNTHRNAQRQSPTTSLHPKFLHRSAPLPALDSPDARLIPGCNSGNGTRAKRGEL